MCVKTLSKGSFAISLCGILFHPAVCDMSDKTLCYKVRRYQVHLLVKGLVKLPLQCVCVCVCVRAFVYLLQPI